MNVPVLNTVEIKLDRIIDEMRSLRQSINAFDARVRKIEYPVKEPEIQPKVGSSITTKIILLTVGIIVGAVLTRIRIYLGV